MAIALAALSGTAAAAPGNGNANGNGPSKSQGAQNSQSTANNGNGNGPQAAPGNAAQPAPAGQPAPAVHAQAATSAPAPTTAEPAAAAEPTGATGATGPTPPGLAKKTTLPPGHAKRLAPGVQPNDTTRKWATCTVGGSASSPTCAGNGPKADGSKQYGNGQTAAGVALGNGAPAGSVLTGPGNSQPHKITGCGMPDNRSGGVDVHAYRPGVCPTAAATAAPAVAAPVRSTTAPPVHRTTQPAAPASATDVTAPPDVTAASAGDTPWVEDTVWPADTSAKVLPTGGVLGAKATVARKPKHETPGGVLGAVPARVGTYVTQKNLPFTGLRLWIVALGGFALIACGLALRARRSLA